MILCQITCISNYFTGVISPKILKRLSITSEPKKKKNHFATQREKNLLCYKKNKEETFKVGPAYW